MTQQELVSEKIERHKTIARKVGQEILTFMGSHQMTPEGFCRKHTRNLSTAKMDEWCRGEVIPGGSALTELIKGEVIQTGLVEEGVHIYLDAYPSQLPQSFQAFDQYTGPYWGHLLKAWRNAKSLKQEDAAVTLGDVKPAVISSVERGFMTLPLAQKKTLFNLLREHHGVFPPDQDLPENVRDWKGVHFERFRGYLMLHFGVDSFKRTWEMARKKWGVYINQGTYQSWCEEKFQPSLPNSAKVQILLQRYQRSKRDLESTTLDIKALSREVIKEAQKTPGHAQAEVRTVSWVSSGGIPVEETPVEATPVEETPVEETPVEETPSASGITDPTVYLQPETIQAFVQALSQGIPKTIKMEVKITFG